MANYKKMMDELKSEIVQLEKDGKDPGQVGVAWANVRLCWQQVEPDWQQIERKEKPKRKPSRPVVVDSPVPVSDDD